MQKDEIRGIEKTIGAQINTLRKMRKLTQKQFAERLSERGMPVDASAVSRMEKGDRALRVAECLIIAEVLETDVSMLLRGIQTPAQELSENRKFSDFSLQAMSDRVWDWLTFLMVAKWSLEDQPELASTIGEGFSEGDSYLPWVSKRLRQLPWDDSESPDEPAAAAIIVRDNQERQELLDCVSAYFENRIRVMTDGE